MLHISWPTPHNSRGYDTDDPDYVDRHLPDLSFVCTIYLQLVCDAIYLQLVSDVCSINSKRVAPEMKEGGHDVEAVLHE